MSQHSHHSHDHHDHSHHDHADCDHSHHDHAEHHAHHGHSHHGHHHGHHHGLPSQQGRAFVIAILLNMGFVLVEFGYGFFANSTALMADAGHNLSDVLGLVLAWAAAILAKRTASNRYTYGLRSSSILAALGNSMLLLVACGAIAWEALLRFSQPPVVAGFTVSLVALVGIAVNGVSAWLFMKGSEHDLNIRAAYLHMAADAAVSLGVAVAGVVIVFTGWYWLDPLASLVIVLVILVSTWGLLRDSVQLALHAVPPSVEVKAVEDYLLKLEGVADIHDLHIWGMSTTESALSVHLVMPAGYPGDAFMDGVVDTLKQRFGVHHSTLQMEQGTTQHSCALHS